MCRPPAPRPRFLAQEPLSQAREAQASSSSQSVTTGAELLAKGQVGVQKRDTSSPAPLSPPLLRSSPCPTQGCATRGQRPPRSASWPGRRAPLTPCPRPPGRAKAPAGASRGLPPHFSRSGWGSSSTCSNRPGDRRGRRSRDSLRAHPRSLVGSRACPAPEPDARGARPPDAPLPEAGAEAVSAAPRSPPPQPQPQLPSARGAGEVAGWRMLLPTEGRGRNGNRNHRRRLTEPPAPVTEGEREAARAGQSLTARDRARAGSRARDPEQRRPHSAGRGRRRAAWGLGGGGEGRGPGAEGTRPLRSAGGNARTRRGGSDNESGRGNPGQRKRERAEGGARPSAFPARGRGRACAGACHLRRPRHVPGLLPAPSWLRPWIARRSILGQERPGPQRDRASSSSAAAARAGAGSNASVGRPLPLEGRRLRGARDQPASHSRERHLQGIPHFRPLGRTGRRQFSRGPKEHLVLEMGSGLSAAC